MTSGFALFVNPHLRSWRCPLTKQEKLYLCWKEKLAKDVVGCRINILTQEWNAVTNNDKYYYVGMSGCALIFIYT